MRGVFLPLILKSCPIFPLFVTLKTTVPAGKLFFESLKPHSFAVTKTVVAFAVLEGEASAGTTSPAAAPMPARASVATAIRSRSQRVYLLSVNGIAAPSREYQRSFSIG